MLLIFFCVNDDVNSLTCYTIMITITTLVIIVTITTTTTIVIITITTTIIIIVGRKRRRGGGRRHKRLKPVFLFISVIKSARCCRN